MLLGGRCDAQAGPGHGADGDLNRGGGVCMSKYIIQFVWGNKTFFGRGEVEVEEKVLPNINLLKQRI